MTLSVNWDKTLACHTRCEARWTLSLPQTSRANPVQCYSTHLERWPCLWSETRHWHVIRDMKLHVRCDMTFYVRRWRRDMNLYVKMWGVTWLFMWGDGDGTWRSIWSKTWLCIWGEVWSLRWSVTWLFMWSVTWLFMWRGGGESYEIWLSHIWYTCLLSHVMSLIFLCIHQRVLNIAMCIYVYIFMECTPWHCSFMYV